MTLTDPGMSEDPHPLRIFLCHSSGDKEAVRALYQRLRAEGFDPWLDEESLLPGQDWGHKIPDAVSAADIVLVCLSRNSVNKKGYVQKEIKYALDAADEQPDDTIYLIPLKLEECDIPARLRHLHWVSLFEANGYDRLLNALRHRTKSIPTMPGSSVQDPSISAAMSPLDFDSSDLALTGHDPERKKGITKELAASRTPHLRTGAVVRVGFLVAGVLFVIAFYIFLQWLDGGLVRRATYGRDAAKPMEPSPAISMSLSPLLGRADGEIPTIKTQTGVETVRLQLLLVADKYEAYRAELQTDYGKFLMSFDELQTSTQGNGQTVNIDMPARILVPGHYEIKLYGIADGRTLLVGAFYFRVIDK